MNLGLSPVCSATVFKVSLTLIDQEGVVSGHLIGRTSPGGLMNIHEDTGGGAGAFVNATFHSTPGIAIALTAIRDLVNYHFMI